VVAVLGKREGGVVGEREREEGRWCVLLSTVLSERDGGGSVVG
jgi:hypothetical protein